MHSLYLITLIPLFIGGYFWLTNKEVIWFEWLIGVLVGLLTIGIFHGITFMRMTSDTQIVSGFVTKATHYPRWVERDVYVTTTTDSKGRPKTVTRVRYITHPEKFIIESDLPESFSVNKEKFKEISNLFGGTETETPYKSGFTSGDRNIYVANNKTNYKYPVNTTRSWTNRIKAAPTLFSYSEVSKNIPAFEYPKETKLNPSNRLIGRANGDIDIREWDLLNSRLGAAKKINLILIGFENQDISIADYQESKWIGGKKNDLVICYGFNDGKITWSKVFGWTEKEIVKENIQSLILTDGINNDIIPKLEREIYKNYQIKDWSKLDYIAIEPPVWSYFVLVFVMGITQTVLWIYFHNNELSKYNATHKRKFQRFSFQAR